MGGHISTLRSTQVAPLKAAIANSARSASAASSGLRHSLLVRVVHWVMTFCFFALLISGSEIVISHPRFYWGETGNVLTQPLFKLPIPSSRRLVPTGYNYVLPDQNGWSRALHFQSAWVLLLAGLLYLLYGLISRHFYKNLLPAKAALSWRTFRTLIAHPLNAKSSVEDVWSYNLVQRLAYLGVIFLLFPLLIWTGLAMSPAFDAAIPATVTLLGGRQSARTLHLCVSLLLLLFVCVHVFMVWRAGFADRMRTMITGRVNDPKERP